ncbi:MAG: PQQ-binding-like beta-propeller repeat protein [Gemmataceae bacterium]
MSRVAGLLVLFFSPALLADDWPQFLGPSRNSQSREKDLLERLPKDGPERVWSYKVGLGYAGPAVAKGRCVIFHRVGNEDRVEALDALTGKHLWRVVTKTDYSDPLGKGDGPRAVPTIADDRVFALGANGVLTAVSLEQGKKLWAVDLLARYEVPASYFGVGTAPLVVDNKVLVNVGAEGAGVVAFDVQTGKEVWKASNDRASYASPVLAKFGGVSMAIFFTRHGLLALEPETGKQRFSMRWRARIDASVNAASPVVIDDQLFLTASYGTGAILLRWKKDGFEEVWQSDRVLSCHFNTPVVVGEQMYGVQGRQEEGAKLRCIDWKTGKVRWTQDGFGCGSLIAAGTQLIGMSESGELILFRANAEKYEELGRARVLNGTVRAHLALANGRLYGRDEEKLVCWKLTK